MYFFSGVVLMLGAVFQVQSIGRTGRTGRGSGGEWEVKRRFTPHDVDGDSPDYFSA